MNPNSTPQRSRTRMSPAQTQAEHLHEVDPGVDVPGSGAGIPARAPQTEREPTDSPWTPKEASIKSSIALPHERDEDTAMTARPNEEPSAARIAQASEDLARGLKDTSRANETDQAYHRLHEHPPPRGRSTR